MGKDQDQDDVQESSDEYDRLVQLHQRLANVSVEAQHIVRESGLSWPEVIRRMGQAPRGLARRMTQGGGYTVTLETLAKLAWACGYELEVAFRKVKQPGEPSMGGTDVKATESVGLDEALAVALDWAEDRDGVPPELSARLLRVVSKLKLASAWISLDGESTEYVRVAAASPPGSPGYTAVIARVNLEFSGPRQGVATGVLLLSSAYGGGWSIDDRRAVPWRYERYDDYSAVLKAMRAASDWVDAQLVAAGWHLIPNDCDWMDQVDDFVGLRESFENDGEPDRADQGNLG